MAGDRALKDVGALEETDDQVSSEMREMSEYISDAINRKVPEETLEKARHHVLDTFAAAVSGSKLKAGALALNYARSLGGAPQCTVICADFLTNPVNAAFANGMMAHADETDDSHLGGRFHPGCGIVPSAFAAAELNDSAGSAFLKSVILGYDIGVRVNRSLGVARPYTGGHSSHSVGTIFGGAAAAASLMRFSPEQVRYLLSYTVQQASGVQCWARDDQHVEKAFDFAGMTARNALAAATMVAAGFTGVADALSGENNFYTAFAEDAKPEILKMDLGSKFEIDEATIKKWCVGSPIQGVIDAIEALSTAQDLPCESIDKIVIELPDDRAGLVSNRRMLNISVQHLVAVALLDGGLTFANSHDYERGEDPAVQELKTKMMLVPNAELTKAVPPRQVIVTIHTRDGKVARHRTHAVKGTPANPMTRAEVEAKALDLTAPILGKERARQLNATLLSIDSLPKLTPLQSLLCA